jgi:hypothetical protein
MTIKIPSGSRDSSQNPLVIMIIINVFPPGHRLLS